MELGQPQFLDERSLTGQHAVIDHHVIKVSIEAVSSINHFFDSQDRVCDIRVVHSQNREILHHLLMVIDIIKLRNALNILVIEEDFFEIGRVLLLPVLVDLRFS